MWSGPVVPGRYRVAVATTPPPPSPLVVALVGMMGSGKSTVAAAVARRTGRRVVDLDHEVEVAAGRSIPELFAEGGEDDFRARELAVLRAVLDTDVPTVLATGGGVVTTAEARAALREGALVVWLDAPVDVLAARVGAGTDRPLLAGDPVRRLRVLDEARRGLYEEVADVVVDASTGTPDDVAARVVEALEVAV